MIRALVLALALTFVAAQSSNASLLCGGSSGPTYSHYVQPCYPTHYHPTYYYYPTTYYYPAYCYPTYYYCYPVIVVHEDEDEDDAGEEGEEGSTMDMMEEEGGLFEMMDNQ